jgi:hypothetical protein
VIYLVDANVLSEATKPAPDAKVVEWLRRNEREIAVDPIILGEIRFGIHLLSAGRRRHRLERWFNEGGCSQSRLPSVGSRHGSSLGKTPRQPSHFRPIDAH